MAPGEHLPLHRIFPWEPFRLDALGLVTLLGAEEVSRAIGGLQHSLVTEYLPLMGAYLVAANKFTDPLPGYKAYNITDGIIPPSLNGSFTRWLDNHIYSNSRRDDNTTIVTWTLAPKADVDRSWRKHCFPLVIGIVLNSALLVITILMADWYGIANSAGMILSVAVRWFLLRENRLQLGRWAEIARARLAADPAKPEHLEEKRILVEPPSSSKIVVNKLPGALIPCLVAPLASPHQKSYRFARLVGWFAFAVHIICIGQSSLVAQLIAVGLLICGTMGTIYRIGCDEEEFGQFLIATTNSSKQQRRECFAELKPTAEEEKALKTWSLLPLEVSHTTDWYKDYTAKKLAHIASDAPLAIVNQGASNSSKSMIAGQASA